MVALSRSALTVATALAERTKGKVDRWGVEQLVTEDGTVIGAIGEDDAVVLDAVASVSDTVRDVAIAAARQRLRAELAALKAARAIGDCAKVDVVLVADGLFSAAYARVAVDAVRKLGARRIVIASPVVSREVSAQLDGKVDAVATLEWATIADSCLYRDDGLPSDMIAMDLLRPRAPTTTLRAAADLR